MADETKIIESADGRLTIAANAREELTHRLADPDMRSGPTRRERRDAMRAEAQRRTDADPRPEQLQAIAQAAIGRGQREYDAEQRRAEEMKEGPRVKTQAEANERFHEYLAGETDRFASISDEYRESYAAPAMAEPVTTVAAIQLQTDLGRLDVAQPPQALQMVRDAAKRGDAPFLLRARQNIAAMAGDGMMQQGYRASWRGPEADKLRAEVFEIIDDATWSVDAELGAYVEERVGQYKNAWRYLVGLLMNEKRLDPVQIRSGALAPLVEPER